MGEDLVPPHLGVSAHDLRNSRVLFLKSRQITDSDCAAIAPLLKQNKALNQLFIGYNDFGDEGARHLCEALAAIEGAPWQSFSWQLRQFHAGCNIGSQHISCLLRIYIFCINHNH